MIGRLPWKLASAATLKALDMEMEYLSDRMKKLEPPPPRA